MKLMAARRIFGSLLDILYPPACPLCGARVFVSGEPCGACASRINALDSDAKLDLPWKVHLGRVRSCFAHEDPVRRALWSLKYEGAAHALGFFCDALARRSLSMGEYDAVVSVPMPSRRIVLRGIDSAGMLARGLASRAGLPYVRGLVRQRGGRSRQVGLSRADRIENARGAFLAGRGSASGVKGKVFLIVDDVMTTGATLNECARALMKAGAASVDALTAARAL